MSINIAYSSSDAYAKCTGISMLSLFVNNKDVKDLTVYLFSTDISDKNKALIESMAKEFERKIIFIEISNQINEIANKYNLKSMRGGYNTYVRLFASEWLNDVERLLFIDSDTLVVHQIKELFDTPMDDNLIAAVPEVGVYGKHNYGDDPQIIDNISKYINAGVMLINLQQWKKEGISSYIAEEIKKYNNDWQCSEQSIFNYTLNNRCKYIHLKYNFYGMFHFESYEEIKKNYNIEKIISHVECSEASKDPVIIHFIGLPYSRPWYKKNISPFRKLYMQYYNQSPWANEKLVKIPRNPQLSYRIYDHVLYLTRKYKLKRTRKLIVFLTKGKFKNMFRKAVGKRKW
jgi:lipopolysaccharide biosynthesis glycosyltransferase